MLSLLWNITVVIVLTPIVLPMYLCKWTWSAGRYLCQLLGWLPPLPPREVETPEPPTFYRRRFALALGDILYRRHNINCDSYEIKAEIDPARREQLFKALLAETGMRADGDLRQQAAQLSQRWLHAFSPEHRDFFYYNARNGDVRNAIAFECVRVAFLVRCMVIFDLLDESRAWFILFLNAQRAQDCFGSWSEFAYAYADGRVVWTTYADQGGGTSQRARLEVEQYITESNSNWQTLPWHAMRIFSPERIHLAPHCTEPLHDRLNRKPATTTCH